MRSDRRALRRAAGFTLIELMIAFVAASFTIIAVYYLSGVSARTFSEQMRVSETQMSLRGAMDQVRADLARAGYFGARNSTQLPACVNGGPTIPEVTPVPLQAVSITSDGSYALAATGAAVRADLNPPVNVTRADVVSLIGNYVTSDAYLVESLTTQASNPTQIFIQNGTMSFQRSFFDPAFGATPAAYNAQRFANTFAAGRMVRIESNKHLFFRTITAVDSTQATPNVTVTPALPDCFVAGDAMIAPVIGIQYALEMFNAGGTARPALTRREFQPSDGTFPPNNWRVVLDYAVEFQVNAWTDTAAAGQVPLLTYITDTGAPNVNTVSTTTPEQFRSLVVTLSARTAEADPRLSRIDRVLLTDPMLTFAGPDPTGTRPAMSRVRTLRTEVFLPNLAQSQPR